MCECTSFVDLERNDDAHLVRRFCPMQICASYCATLGAAFAGVQFSFEVRCFTRCILPFTKNTLAFAFDIKSGCRRVLGGNQFKSDTLLVGFSCVIACIFLQFMVRLYSPTLSEYPNPVAPNICVQKSLGRSESTKEIG